MTEDDAKGKICPQLYQAMVFLAVHAGKNNADEALLDQTGTTAYCVGSDCMMWVATDNECEPAQEPKDISAVVPEPKCYPAGRCGLVGKPGGS